MGTALRRLTRFSAVLAVAVPLAACGDSAENEREAGLRAVDSMAAARARGEVDLSNPEMGAKVGVNLSEWQVDLSHESIEPGQVTFAIQNTGAMRHSVEIRGTGGTWSSMPLNPRGGYVTMSMVMEPGEYEVTCPDSAGVHTERGMSRRFVVQ